MLPIQKKDATVALPVDQKMRKPDEDKPFDVMEAVASDLIDAIMKKDIQGCAEALKAAFELADSEPHIEGPHE